MQRAPVILSFLLFLLLCASVAYWLLQWLAPAPRPLAPPPQAERAMPPVAAASNLFGGRVQGAGNTNVQLRGIIRAGRGSGSVAIIAAEGKPVRALRVDGEVLPGLTVKEINARSVVLSERGTERELSLPAFAAQEGGATLQSAAAPPVPSAASPPPQQQPAPPPTLPQPSATGASTAGGASGASGTAGTGNSGAGTMAYEGGGAPPPNGGAVNGAAPGTAPGASVAPAQPLLRPAPAQAR